MKAPKAIGLVLVAGILAGAVPAVAGQGTGAPGTGRAVTTSTGAYQLTAEIPAAIRRGQVVTLTLHVLKGGQPVDHVATCMASPPLFVDVEDALDPTPAGGFDLGTSRESATRSACAMAMAGVPSGPGTYAFTWEPDTPGRVNVTFTAGGSALAVPVDVASRPPSAALLMLFGLLVVTILITAAIFRHRSCPEGAAR
jgi:hypothetical protein